MSVSVGFHRVEKATAKAWELRSCGGCWTVFIQSGQSELALYFQSDDAAENERKARAVAAAINGGEA